MSNPYARPSPIAQKSGSRSAVRTRLTAALALAACFGCATGPDYEAPVLPLPDAWHQELTRGLAEGKADLQTWWEIFDDPVLNGLIERAASGNITLQEAYARIVEGRAIVGIASGEFYPDLDAIGAYQRSRTSEELAPIIAPGQSREDDFFQAGIDTSWEIDVFGRIRRSVESADAALEASVEAYRDVLVLLYAEVALAYIDVRTLQRRLALVAGNVQTQAATLQLTQDRLNAQLAPQLDVSQAQLNLATTESFAPILRILLTESINRLGVLLGKPPNTLHTELAVDAGLPQTPAQVVVGLPADLLRQRPDIRRAERELAAQTARIGVATADLYPRFSLLGTFAFEAKDFGKLWDQASHAYAFGPAVRWNLFAGGRIRNNIRAEDARAQQALLRYEQTVLEALEEVENAMVGFAQEGDRRDALERAAVAARESVEYVQTLYTTGLTDFQNVQSTERSMFEREDAHAKSEGLVLKNLVRVYRALGGGWSTEADGQEPVVAETE